MNTTTALETLADALPTLTPVPQHPALQHLVESLRQRHAGCVQSILFYGSCLRSGDPFDGLVDLYLIVDNYRCANSGWLKALWNRLLPPNVFYAEFPYEKKIIRCKYAVLTADDFHRGTSMRWFQTYLWGRFSQPTALAWWRDDSAHRRSTLSMARAVITFLNRALPSVPAAGSVQTLWQAALKLSYATELRPESHGRARELTAANAAYYQRITALAAPKLRYPLIQTATGDYQTHIPATTRWLNRQGWRLRTLQGKLLSLARLSKALFTFDGGLDYIAWKLERHTGEAIEIPDRVRRYPLVFVWGMVWRLYRRGVFR